VQRDLRSVGALHEPEYELPLVWVLPEWHRGWTPRKELAFDLGLSEWSLRRAMKYTENKVKLRLAEAGLLEAA
jgi:hypothetical protein